MDWRLKTLGPAVLLLGSIGAAGAQETPRDGDTATATTPLDAVTITATRNPIEAFVYPGMVTVIGPEDIATEQGSTPDDLLRSVPNVEFTGGPRRTGEVPSIRGFTGPDVVVTLDGARQNFQSGHDGRFFVDPSLLREVEVLRGPASALYGSGGTGGVIALRTVRAADFLAPDETLGGHLAAGFHSGNDESVGIATVYGRPAAGLDLLGSITRRESDEIELGDGSKLDRNDEDLLSGLFKAGWAPAEGHRLEASFQRFDNETTEPNNGQGAGDDNLVDKQVTADNWRLAHDYAGPGNPWIDLSTTLYRTVTEVDERRLDGNGNGPAGERLRREIETTGLRLENRSALAGGDLLLTYGVEAYRDEQDGEDASGTRESVPDAETDFGAVFAQAEWRVARPFGAPGELLVVPGVRFDRYESSSAIADDNDDEEVSPRLGLSYLPTGWSMLFVNVADAFRAPTVNELYTSGVHFEIQTPVGTSVNRFVPNPDLDPQRTSTVEFGAGLDFRDVFARADRLRLKASRFKIDGDDFIDLDVDQPPPPADGTTRSYNVPEAELSGYEAEAAYAAGRLRLVLGASTLDGNDKRTGEPLGILTPPQFTLDAAWRLPALDALVGWRMLAADDFDNTDEEAEERPGYAVHDLYAAWTPDSERLAGLRIDVGVNNVFDKAYSRVYTDALEMGRDLRTRVSYRFD
ncbi:TonB-dependent hemoglobin [Salinisphaera sp. PC39]|uniref:TonB-dependent receptor domain-containing protein n=1 Tax=Salinisphaera sp. PC39 TaxID=1304156 RepID=UPI003342C594